MVLFVFFSIHGHRQREREREYLKSKYCCNVCCPLINLTTNLSNFVSSISSCFVSFRNPFHHLIHHTELILLLIFPECRLMYLISITIHYQLGTDDQWSRFNQPLVMMVLAVVHVNVCVLNPSKSLDCNQYQDQNIGMMIMNHSVLNQLPIF